MTDLARPLKILLTDPHLRGGGQVRYVTNLARELVRLGHDVVIGCKKDSVLVARAREVEQAVSLLAPGRLTVCPASAACRAHNAFTFRGGLRPRCWLHDVTEGRRFIIEEKPDILHSSGSQDHWTLAIANRLLGFPTTLVRTRHNTYPVHDGLTNRTLNRQWTDYQIVVCHVVRETLAQQRSFDPARMCSIHNGVDAEQFRPDAALRRKARAEFGYHDDHLVCGIAARLVEAKGHPFLFRAAAQMRAEIPQLRILVLGQGDQEPELRRLCQECGIGDRVAFAGFRDDMAYCTQAFDIGIQPSIDCDTSSFSLKEQMACEKPVIASDYGGLKEIVTDQAEGIVVPTGTVEPIARALRTLAGDAALRTRMGRAGRERVLREFTVQVFAQRTAEAYYRAIEIHHERLAH